MLWILESSNLAKLNTTRLENCKTLVVVRKQRLHALVTMSTRQEMIQAIIGDL
jgi:hypothetical protein